MLFRSWVADYRDPWTKYPGNNLDFSKPYNQLFAALEYILLKQADCNIMVEESLAHSYTVSVQLPAKKVVCITNGYDEKDFSDLAESEMKSEKFTINYSGVLHTEHAVRAFSTLLEAIYQLKLEKAMDFNQISLYMIGDIQEGQVVLQKYDWGNTLVETGYVSHAEVLQLNSTASILLLPIGDTPDLKPVHAGTFFDYLLEKAHLVGTPGAGFGRNGVNFFRLTAFGDQEKTLEAAARLKQLL